MPDEKLGSLSSLDLTLSKEHLWNIWDNGIPLGQFKHKTKCGKAIELGIEYLTVYSTFRVFSPWLDWL